jgi:hypothetical protein
VNDDELEARLRRLGARADEDDPGPQHWEAMAAEVRAAYERELRNRDSKFRRRRWLAAPLVGALALAAAFAVYVRVHPVKPAAVEDEMSAFDEPDTDELIDELSPAQLERVAQAFKKGA